MSTNVANAKQAITLFRFTLSNLRHRGALDEGHARNQ
jgi:hypothetical protein